MYGSRGHWGSGNDGRTASVKSSSAVITAQQRYKATDATATDAATLRWFRGAISDAVAMTTEWWRALTQEAAAAATSMRRVVVVVDILMDLDSP